MSRRGRRAYRRRFTGDRAGFIHTTVKSVSFYCRSQHYRHRPAEPRQYIDSDKRSHHAGRLLPPPTAANGHCFAAHAITARLSHRPSPLSRNAQGQGICS